MNRLTAITASNICAQHESGWTSTSSYKRGGISLVGAPMKKRMTANKAPCPPLTNDVAQSVAVSSSGGASLKMGALREYLLEPLSLLRFPLVRTTAASPSAVVHVPHWRRKIGFPTQATRKHSPIPYRRIDSSGCCSKPTSEVRRAESMHVACASVQTIYCVYHSLALQTCSNFEQGAQCLSRGKKEYCVIRQPPRSPF
jgi:hypothetical protein